MHLHQTNRNHNVRDQIRCILLSADGWTPGMSTQLQLIHKTTVRRHLNDWLNGEKIASANSDSNSHLSEEKTAELVTYLTNNLLAYHIGNH